MNEIRQQLAKLSPQQRALLEQKLFKTRLPDRAQTIPCRETMAPCLLSFAQQRLWFLAEMNPDRPIYNVPIAVRLGGPLHIDALRKSLDTIVARHDVLRTTYAATAGYPQQIVNPSGPVALSVVDLRPQPEDYREIEWHRLLVEESRRPFDLTSDLMLRSLLIQLGDDDHILLIVVHHIATDGWSMELLWREISISYEAYQRSEAPPLPALPIQYADYALWQRQHLIDQRLNDLLQYWKRQLDGIPARLELPTDWPRPSVQAYRGAKHAFTLSPSLTEALNRFSRQEKVTLFVLLLTAWKILLYRYSGQDTVVVGSPVAGRLRQETESLIGCFVNTLPLRVDLGGNPRFRELLHQVREVVLGAFAHQELPYEKLVEELGPARHLSHLPIFQVAFALQNASSFVRQMTGLTLAPLSIDNETAKFDLFLAISEGDGALSAVLTYNTDLFEKSTMSRLVANWQTLLEGMIVAPQQRISDLPLLSRTERHQLLETWNDTAIDYPRHACIQQVFENQVEQTPNHVALVHGDRQLTYRELNKRANQLASYLRARGVGPEVLVGICLERSLEMIIGLLGVLKAGGAYVPLEPTYPRDRLAYLLQDTQLSIVVTQASLLALFAERLDIVICLDTDWGAISSESRANLLLRTQAEHLAYVMYTSGSTGQPKGVSITHRGVVRLVKGATYVDFTTADAFLQLAPLEFDASTFEIWGSLLNGGRLILFPGQRPTPQTLAQVLEQHPITTLWLTAELFHQMVDYHPESLASIRQLLAGGDVLSPSHVARALHQLDGGRLINGYGPTEGTTFTCCFPMRPTQPVSSPVPIGTPISNTQIYVLDADLQPVPIGVPGELYIGGDGLARGYWNRPNLTAERFIANPFPTSPSAYLYRTGDRVRYRPDGHLEFLGRLDHQVKIRGFRIELGEIETVIGQHPSVRQVVVVARSEASGSKCLVAYIVPQSDEPLCRKTLRDDLQAKLPDYMIPSNLVWLDALPMTSNGKIDRRSLPEPNPVEVEYGRSFIAPRTPLEQQIAGVWYQLLGTDHIDVQDNFFELGGHSLLATQLMYQLCATLNLDMTPSPHLLYEAPTVEQLAMRLLQNTKRPYGESLVEIQTDGSRAPFFWVHGGESTVLLPRYLGPDQPFYGFRYQSHTGHRARYTLIEEIAAHYLEDVQQIQPQGPYFLGGFCIGAFLAFEMAQQLVKQGEQIALLLMLEPATLQPRARSRQVAGPSPYIFARGMNALVRRFKKFLCQAHIGLGWRIPVSLRTFYMLNIYSRAMLLYHPQAFPGHIHLLQREYLSNTLPRGWADLASEGFTVYEISSDLEHSALVKTDNAVQVWGNIVSECLDKAQGASRLQS